MVLNNVLQWISFLTKGGTKYWSWRSHSSGDLVTFCNEEKIMFKYLKTPNIFNYLQEHSIYAYMTQEVNQVPLQEEGRDEKAGKIRISENKNQFIHY